MSYNTQTRSKTRGGRFNSGAVVRSNSLDHDVRCRINIKAKPSMDIIASQEVLGIKIYQLVHVLKVKHLKEKLVNGLWQFKCVLGDLPEPPHRLISVTVNGKRQEKLKPNIMRLLDSFSGYCEECTVSQKAYTILKYSDLLFTVIHDRGSVIDIVYCKDDSIEWAVDLRNCSEGQKQNLMSLIKGWKPEHHEFDGDKLKILTNPKNTDFIQDNFCNFDTYVQNNDDYVKIHHGSGNGKDTLHNNKSLWKSTLCPNTDPENRYAHNNSQWLSSSSSSTGAENKYADDNSQGQSISNQNTRPENKYAHDNSQGQSFSNQNTVLENRYAHNNSQGPPMSNQNTVPEDRFAHNNSQGPSMSSQNTHPCDRYAHHNSQGQSISGSNIEPGDMTIHNIANVPRTTLLTTSGEALPVPMLDNVRIIPGKAVKVDDSWSVIYHPGNGQDAELGGNTDEKEDNGAATHKEDELRLSPTIKRIDLIYLKLFTKRKPILDKILHCFSQSSYNPSQYFNEDGSIKPSLNNEEFFVLNVAINNVLDIKKVSLKQYNLPGGWVESMNIIENNIVVEEREAYILIVGLKDIVSRVLLNLCQYKQNNNTDDFQQMEANLADVRPEFLVSYNYEFNCPLDCEYICKAGDQLLYELQKYRCVIDIQPLVTGTKEIHFANWIHDSTEAGHQIKIPLVIGDPRTRKNQSDMLVLDQCNQFGKKGFSKAKIKQDLEEDVKRRGCKILILLIDRTTEKEMVSFFLSACKNVSKMIYFPMESRPQINHHLLKNLFEKGKLEYGGLGHYIEIKIGQINKQKVDVIVDVIGSHSQSDTYVIKEIKETVGALQYRFELNIPPCKSDPSNPMINLSFLVMKCLIDASKIKMTSIAFPVMGVGSSGYPVKLVARSMLETIDEYFRCQKETSLCHVMIVIEDGDTNSKEAFFRENLTRIKEGRMTGDRVYKVDIEIIGDERDKLEIKKEIDDIIAKKEIVFNDISNPIKEVLMAADRVDEVNKKITERPTTERDLKRSTTEGDLGRPTKVARVRSMIERERPKTEREDKEKNSGRKEPVVDEDTSRTNSEGTMDVIRKHAFGKRDETHESRCVIIEFTAKDAGMANTQKVLISILKENEPLCVVSPYQGDIYRAFLSFGSKRAKDEARSKIKDTYRNSKFIDMPVSQEVVTPLINRVNIHTNDCNDLKQDLVEASGVNTISNDGEVFIEGCHEQIELAKTMLQTKYSKKRRNQNIEPQPVHLEPHSVKTYKFRALEYLFGYDRMVKICYDVSEVDGETHFTLPKDSKNKLVEDLKDLMYRTIRHEEIDVTDDKKEEANRYSTNHAHMETVYVEFDSKTSSIHILGEDYEDVELVSYQAKVVVGLIKLTNKKQQRTRTDEYTPTPPPVQLAPSEIQERIFYTKCKNLTVHVKKSDITILNVDVIVNAANGMMMHGGGVARFIATAGGDELERECRRYIDENGQLPVTGICKTTGGNMRCKQVYHAVGPCWSNYSNKSDCEDDLCKTIVRCLVEADQDGFQSIAIPSISSAIFGVPKNICAHMYAQAVKSFDAVHTVSNLREIYFVDVLDGMVSMVQTGFDMFFTQGNDDDLIKEEIERFIKEITCKGAEQQPEGEITDNKPPEFSMIAVTKEVDNKPYITCSLQSIITLHIYQASALSTSTESVTTWEDTKMTDLRASAKKIINEAGDKYKEERSKVKTDGGFKTGTVLSTSAGESLPYKHIYHLISSIKPGPKEVDILMANLIKEISLTTDASVTIDIGNIDVDILFTSLVDLFKTANSSTLKEIHLVAESEDKVKKLHSNDGDYIKQLGGIMKTSDINCPICLEEMSDFKTLPCGHTFCAKCVDKAIETNPTCPSCRCSAYGEIQTGNQPDGKMEHKILHTPLQGFPHCDTIEIIYSFNDGIQSASHPRPGYPFKGRTETAYLPDNMEGREILKLLKLAFDKRLIFTVSPDVTSSSGREFVTWNNIPHKTRQDGGPERNGYPDPEYLNQVRKALHTRGVIKQNSSN